MTAPQLHIDFETRSTVDLKAAGLDNYAKHPTTDVWCMAWAIGDGPIEMWTPATAPDAEGTGDFLHDYVREGGAVVAHNAQFELAIWNHIMVPRYGWPLLKPEQTRCTMAMAYAMALPGSLEKAAAAVGIKEQKDMALHRLMLQMCRPRSDNPLTWWDEPDKLQRLYEYCKQDVRVERELAKRILALSESEQKLWAIDHRVNTRGVMVDRVAAARAIAIVEAEQERLNQEMHRATGLSINTTEVARIAKWVKSRGVPMDGLAKADVLDALSLENLPDDVRRALLLRQEAGKSSTAKLQAMIDAASDDGRLRYMLQYHGAGTGRWAGRKVQLHNMPRQPEWFTPGVAEDVIRALGTRDGAAYISAVYDTPLNVISYLLRPLLCAAPGHDLMAADFANIEGRGLAWLAGEEWKLDAFRAYDDGTGPDLYKVAYGRAYGIAPGDVTKDQRQVGKVMELALGYQGGVGAFQKMAKGYNVKISDTVAEQVKTLWRDAHPNIQQYWYALDAAAKRAVLSDGSVTEAGARPAKFRKKGSFLWCKLPSGRLLCYPYARIDDAVTFRTDKGVIKKMSRRAVDRDGTPAGAEILREDGDVLFYMNVDGTSGKWVETDTYGGKLSENITQAICRDLLAAAIIRCEAGGFPVVLHVHDEVVAEVKQDGGDLKYFEQLCAVTPAWAEGLPVAAAGWRGKRYRK